MKANRIAGLLVAVTCLSIGAVPARAEDESDFVDVTVRPAEENKAAGMAARWVAGRPANPIERAKDLGVAAAEGAGIAATFGGSAEMGAAKGVLGWGVKEAKKEVNWIVNGENEE